VHSLRTRLSFSFALLICALGLAGALYISTIFAEQLTKEVHKRGETLARHLAEIGADAVVSEDRLALHSLIHSVEKVDQDVAYIFFVNHSGDAVLAASFDDHFPPQLLNANPLPPGVPISRRELNFGGLPVYDIGAEVLAARAGFVHLGLSTQPIEKAVGILITHALSALLILTFVAIAAVAPITRSITRPIIRLTSAVRQIANGKPEKIDVDGRDEIGELAASYNTMVDALTSTQKAVEAQIAFRDALLNDLPEAVYYKDLSGTVVGCSRVFAEFFGFEPQDLPGKTIRDLFDDIDLHSTKDTELIDTGGVISYEAIVRRHDGANRNIVFFKTIFNDPVEGSIIIGVMQDVTKEREADRIKSEFVSSVAHEFQTPLATIVGFAELIQNRSISGEEETDGARLIMEKAERLSHLVDELLDLSRLETGRSFSLFVESCSLRTIIDGIIDDFRHSAGDRIFETELPAGQLPIVADATRISQVLENLLSNAVKYSEKGSTIRVEVDHGEQKYVIKVRDAGRGMTLEQAVHAFDKFYRADTSDTAPPGTGLGLYLAQSIIAMHGGKIELDSRLGEGTCVTVTLPQSADSLSVESVS